MRVGEVVLEAADVPDVRAAPAVDRLVVVADDAEVPVVADDALQEAVLRGVRVLELVDEDVVEAPADGVARAARVLLEELAPSGR